MVICDAEGMGLIRIGTDRVQHLYRNAKQMKKIVEAKYTGLRFDEEVLGAKELGFECSTSAVRVGDGKHFRSLLINV